MKLSGLNFGAAKPVAPLQSSTVDPNQREAVIKEALAKEPLPIPGAPFPTGNLIAHELRVGPISVCEPRGMQQAKAEPTVASVASQLETIEGTLAGLYNIAGDLQTRLSAVLAPELANGTEGTTQAGRARSTRLVYRLGDINTDLIRLENMLAQLINRLELE